MKRHFPFLAITTATLISAATQAGDPPPAAPGAAPAFTRLLPIPSPKVLARAEEYPGGAFRAEHLVDGNPRTESSSNGKGTESFVEFDLGGTFPLAAFRHVDRNDPATVAASELILLDGDGKPVAPPVPVEHANVRSGITLRVLPSPVEARRVRWRVTRLGPQGHGTVGGAEVEFFRAAGRDPSPSALALEPRLSPLVERKGAGLVQALRLDLSSPYAEPFRATVRVEGLEPRDVEVGFGQKRIEHILPIVETRRALAAAVDVGGASVLRKEVVLEPSRRFEIDLLPHSHVDIGYTALQDEVERKQDENLDIALRLIRETRGYPEGSRFRWNVEVLWPVENYLRKATPEKREALAAAVKAGEVGLDAFHGNILTGLCRPEELVRLMGLAKRLEGMYGVPVESAMISDVPGYTWSTVTAMAHAGVRYFSFAPNYFDRMGGTMVEWQDRPFWWKGPDGRSRVLCWCPSRGYALGHLIGEGEAFARFLPTYLDELEAKRYPYDLTHVRWNVHGDNGSPDALIAAVVRDWNLRYAWPRLRITTTAAAFHEFEARYGDRLPEFAGDYTPYWEDGAGSSALETSMNRASADRLVAAETLWALRVPGPFPASEFHDAWRDVLLYSEHTWGMAGFKPKPQPAAADDLEKNRSPEYESMRLSWRLKGDHAREAARVAWDALRGNLAAAARAAGVPAGDLVVFNPLNWPRTDLVRAPRSLFPAGGFRLEDRGTGAAVAWQADGDSVAFVARDVPPCGWALFRMVPGGAPPEARTRSGGAPRIAAGDLAIEFDPRTGAAVSVRSGETELLDREAPFGLGQYIYEASGKIGEAGWHGSPHDGPGTGRRSSAARSWRIEEGPVFVRFASEGSLAIPDFPVQVGEARRVASAATVVPGLGWIEWETRIEGKTATALSEMGHVAFPFRVDGGKFRLELLGSVVDPGKDLQEAGNADAFAVQHWIDLSDGARGITWCPVEATITSLGDIRLFRWEPGYVPANGRIYSNLFNNGWSTNFQEWQGGDFSFRYRFRPHAGDFARGGAPRFGRETAQPMVAFVAPAGPEVDAPSFSKVEARRSFLLAEGATAVLVNWKRAEDGKGSIVRLHEPCGTAGEVRLSVPGRPIRAAARTLLTEGPLPGGGGRLEVRDGSVTVPIGPYSIETVRIEIER